MRKRFLKAGLHVLFLKWVLLPSLGASLLWWIADSLPHPTKWDLLLHSPAGLLVVVASGGALLWFAKMIVAALAVEAPPTTLDSIISPLIFASLEREPLSPEPTSCCEAATVGSR